MTVAAACETGLIRWTSGMCSARESWADLCSAAPFLVHAHIGDVDPSQRKQPTTRDQQGAFLAELRSVGYRGGVTVSHPLGVYQDPAETVRALRGLIQPIGLAIN